MTAYLLSLLAGLVAGAVASWKTRGWKAEGDEAALRGGVADLQRELGKARDERDAEVKDRDTYAAMVIAKDAEIMRLEEELRAAAHRDPVLAGDRLDGVLHHVARPEGDAVPHNPAAGRPRDPHDPPR